MNAEDTVTADEPTVLDMVRAALAEADGFGRQRPGRPTLMKLTGGTDHQVRQALATIEAETTNGGGALALVGGALVVAGDPGDTPPASPPATPVARPVEPATPVERPAPPDPAPVPAAPTPRRWWRAPGGHPWPLVVIAFAAGVALWGGWVDLGGMTGFGLVRPLPGIWDRLEINTAISLPLSVEAYAGYALHVWLTSAATSRAHRMARWSAVAGLVIGAAAQVASHLLRAAGITVAPDGVTVAVACVPVIALGLATGLATLVRLDATTPTTTASAGDPGHQPATRSDTP
ncbi:hypothetical protein [Actinokineospora spheciospongiae]|uniref:hypothetical protein n=1 Tax=Actinokineospora spheciospongiae TaxID=909613 RepID=UPI000D70A453|nr:hypothetical protein [Actinokineospora spheciospongiae]PWW50244.1 hypothetical protein DFQ13_1236 [Actinokineospora spheciospongiae]